MDRNGLPPTATPAADNATTLTTLVSGIVSDAQTLIRQQVDMLRAEVKEDMARTARVAKYMGAGVAVAALGGLFLAISLVYLLNHLAPSVPLWGCWAIVGGTLAAGGAAAVVAGKRLLDSFNPLPDKTLNAAQENVSWIANPQT